MWWIVILFSTCECLTVFQSQEMCKQDNSDCSFQVPYSAVGSCVIYNSTVCRNFNFFDWVLLPLTKLASESNAPFSVDVVPYALDKVNSLQSGMPISAINISLVVLKEGVSGFEIFLYDDNSSFNMCRIFDFRNLGGGLKVPINFFYDCIYKLVERKNVIQNVTMAFRAFPMNVELSYIISIPHPTEFLSSKCTWKPLFMLFSGSLPKHIVKVKFSQMPKNMHVLAYSVKLLSFSLNEEKAVLTVPANDTQDLLSVEFLSVNEGYHYVSLEIVTPKGIICDGINSRKFYVGSFPADETVFYYMYYMFFIGFVIIVAILIFYCFCNPGSTSSKSHVLLVYSYDCSEHECLIKAFHTYLEKCFNLTVDIIYGKSGSPNDWIKEKYSEADIIMFVISEGLFHTLEKKNIPPLKEGHHWQNQLSVAELYISAEMLNSQTSLKNKKFCTVAFSYSGKHHIPKRLGKGPWRFYKLPNEMDSLLSFIFNSNVKICCTNVHPWLPGHDVKSSEEGKVVLKKISEMKEIVASNLHIQFIKDKLPLETEEATNDYASNCAYAISKTNGHKNNDYENLTYCNSFLYSNLAEKVNNCDESDSEENENLLNPVPSDFCKLHFDEDLRILVRQELHS